jgi:SpoVK/Ycf46/Vps4 family AAA+-type ATPase
VLDKYVGESERRVREVFRRAREVGSVVLLFDDVQLLCGTRDAEGGGTGVEARILSTMLNELDGIESDNGRGRVLVVGACGDVGEVDAAAVREGRMQERIEVGHAARGDVEGMMRGVLEDVRVDADVDWAALATVLWERRGLRGVAAVDVVRWAEAAKRICVARVEEEGEEDGVQVEEVDCCAALDSVFGRGAGGGAGGGEGIEAKLSKLGLNR